MEFNDAVGALTDYSLARRASDSLVVHRLVQDVTRHRHPGQPATPTGQALEVVLDLLRADLPDEVWGIPETWPRWRALLPSVLAATGYHTGTTHADIVAWLLARAATYLRSQGRYAEALPLQQRALRIHEAALGMEHPYVATDLTLVADALSVLGRADEALPLYQRALRIYEAIFGPDHPDTRRSREYVGEQ